MTCSVLLILLFNFLLIRLFKKSGQDNCRMSSLQCQCGTHVGKLHSVSSWRMRLDLLGSLDPPF
ncbi:hypothetical protein EXW28_01780 [Bacillus mycoides]|nr:hypothetical protein EXW37_01780 [Bacillus mycoides]QWH32472.1 hypothetical protein EXW28_01780 [Bacillus mycoides]